MKAWVIKDWDTRWESASSRKLKHPEYISLRVDMDSLNFRELMTTADGAMAFGHFMALVELAASMPCRGRLFRSGRALNPDHCAALIGIPAELLHRSWNILANLGKPFDQEGWIHEAEIEPEMVEQERGARSPLTYRPAEISHEKPPDPPPDDGAREKSATDLPATSAAEAKISQQPPSDPPKISHQVAGLRASAHAKGRAGQRRAEEGSSRAGTFAAAASSEGGKPEDKPELRGLLRRAGIAEPTRSMLCETLDISPAKAQAVIARSLDRGKGVGAIVLNLREAAEKVADVKVHTAAQRSARDALRGMTPERRAEIREEFFLAFPFFRTYTGGVIEDVAKFQTFVLERVAAPAC